MLGFPLFVVSLTDIGVRERYRVMVSPGQDFMPETFTIAVICYQPRHPPTPIMGPRHQNFPHYALLRRVTCGKFRTVSSLQAAFGGSIYMQLRELPILAVGIYIHEVADILAKEHILPTLSIILT